MIELPISGVITYCLALDQASKKTGFCVAAVNQVIHFHVITSGVIAVNGSPVERLIALRKDISELLDAYPSISWMVCEDLTYIARNAKTRSMLAKVTGVCEEVAHQYNKNFGVHSTGTIKAFGVGWGNAKKCDVMDAMAQRFPYVDITEEDQADAIMGAYYWAHNYKLGVY